MCYQSLLFYKSRSKHMNANTQKIRFHSSLHHYQCGKQNIEEDLYHFPTKKLGVIELKLEILWQKNCWLMCVGE